MAKINSIEELANPQFVKAIKINYTQKEQNKVWEAVLSHNSVSTLLWHKEKDSFVLVKQLRPAILHTDETNGYTYELCAGIIDKEASDLQIAKEEIIEECGYDVPLQSIKKVTKFYPAVGITGAYQKLYYAELTEGMKVHEGGGIHDEEIEVIYLKVSEAKKFMFDEKIKKAPGLMLAFYWFFENKM
ncbi:MAG: NUDIX hydrolase [Campylobacterales bacterium]|nr:NUDIX hydrolase [Campylobacterales bacterium]